MSTAGIRRVSRQLAESVSGREREILSLLSDGETLQSIGDALGVTRERVRQIAEKSSLRAGEALGVEVPDGPEEVATVFGDRQPQLPPLCSECSRARHIYSYGRCKSCYNKWRRREVPGVRERHRVLMERNRREILMQAKRDEGALGLGMTFGKKSMPERTRTGKWRPILEKANSLEPSDWFSVDLPSGALAASARQAVIAYVRNRWPRSLADADRRDFRCATEGETLFVKRLR